MALNENKIKTEFERIRCLAAMGNPEHSNWNFEMSEPLCYLHGLASEIKDKVDSILKDVEEALEECNR